MFAAKDSAITRRSMNYLQYIQRGCIETAAAVKSAYSKVITRGHVAVNAVTPWLNSVKQAHTNIVSVRG